MAIANNLYVDAHEASRQRQPKGLKIMGPSARVAIEEASPAFGVAPYLPPSLHRYFTHLDDGLDVEASNQYAEDAICARPPAGADGLPREISHGRRGVAETLRLRGNLPKRHHIQSSAGNGPVWFVDGVVKSDAGGAIMSFLSAVTLDAAGLIARYVAFRSEVIPHVDTREALVGSRDGLPLVRRWLGARSTGDEAGADLLSPTAIYSDSELRNGSPTGQRVAAIGRADVAREELTSAGHAVAWSLRSYAQQGSLCFGEGILGDNQGTFVLAAVLDGHNRFLRLYGHVCSDPVPGLVPTIATR